MKSLWLISHIGDGRYKDQGPQQAWNATVVPPALCYSSVASHLQENDSATIGSSYGKHGPWVNPAALLFHTHSFYTQLLTLHQSECYFFYNMEGTPRLTVMSKIIQKKITLKKEEVCREIGLYHFSLKPNLHWLFPSRSRNTCIYPTWSSSI